MVADYPVLPPATSGPHHHPHPPFSSCPVVVIVHSPCPVASRICSTSINHSIVLSTPHCSLLTMMMIEG